MKIQHVECDDHRHTTILVEGLRRQVTLMHITDSHMYEADERDPEAIEAAADWAWIPGPSRRHRGVKVLISSRDEE